MPKNSMSSPLRKKAEISFDAARIETAAVRHSLSRDIRRRRALETHMLLRPSRDQTPKEIFLIFLCTCGMTIAVEVSGKCEKALKKHSEGD